MNAPHRSSLMAVGLAATLAVTLPSVLTAQRQQVPGPDTRRVLVTAFRGDVEGGVKAANEIRDRIQSEFSIRQLMPTSKKDIDNSLASSGYPVDSALSPNDIKALAKLVRGDEIIDGTVQKVGSGYRINARMFLPRDAGLSQPLVTNLETKDLGDAAKQVVSEYDRARKQIPDNQACENGIRNNTPADAIFAARRGIQTYPKATIVRLCLASSYAAMKTTADSTGPWKDSVIAITKTVIDLDQLSRIAYQLQIDAYRGLNDTTNLVHALLGYMNSDPTNVALREQVIADVIGLGMAHLAVPIAKRTVDENPGESGYLKTYWLVLRAAKQYKAAVPIGIALVKIDTAAADSNYFFRQVQDLAFDSSYTKAAEMAAEGFARFPKATGLLLSKAQNERRAGMLGAAKATLETALATDQKLPGANMVLAQVSNDLGATADAIRAVKADVAANPMNKDRDAQFLLQFGTAAYKVAVASKKPDDSQRARAYLKASDEINPTKEAAFFTAVSAFAELQQAAETLPRSRSCEEFKSASDLLTTVSTYMPRGGQYNPEAAKQILGAVPQFQAFIDGSVKKYCK